MRTTFLAATLAGIALLATAAAADDMQGTIKKIDTDKGIMVLADGSQFVIPDEFNIEGLDPGTKVLVFYDVVDGKKTLNNIEVSE
ncbi:MAG: DUF1344 domain-containing protein [Hyphomicrobiales bacterium]